MAKVKTSFFCKVCGNESPKWLGRCPACGEWNSFVEEVTVRENKGSRISFSSQPGNRREAVRPVTLSEIEQSDLQRIDMYYPEVNRVLGGGLVPGSLILLGGEPGIGKSTLSLQLALHTKALKILYVSGEESPQQIKIRAERLQEQNDNCFILAETSLEMILEVVFLPI